MVCCVLGIGVEVIGSGIVCGGLWCCFGGGGDGDWCTVCGVV